MDENADAHKLIAASRGASRASVDLALFGGILHEHSQIDDLAKIALRSAAESLEDAAEVARGLAGDG